MTVLHTGSTKKYAANWQQAFGGTASAKSAKQAGGTKKAAAKKKSAGKKSAKSL